ncbi:IS5 family transposase [Streptomyces canus]|uniref:IS5 family transposase n=1 Tax=Streptomyces canus TaxID=58343 RepID=UPI0033D543A4
MTEAEWQVIRAVLPVPAWLEGRGGRPEGFCRRQMIDAVRYVAYNGVKSANLPAEFPPYRRVHAFARRRQVTGLLAELHDRLRDRVRAKEGRLPGRTAAIVDSQSVRAAANIPRSTSAWYGGKKVGGRKRRLVVDCLGLVLAVAASVQDRDAAVPLLKRLRTTYFSLRLVWADGGCAGSLVDWAREKLRLTLQIVKRTDDTRGFVALPRRWVVENTLCWLMRSRRLVREYETLPAMHEAMVLWSIHAHERPSGRTPPRCFQPAGTARAVNALAAPGWPTSAPPGAWRSTAAPRPSPGRPPVPGPRPAADSSCPPGPLPTPAPPRSAGSPARGRTPSWPRPAAARASPPPPFAPAPRPRKATHPVPRPPLHAHPPAAEADGRPRPARAPPNSVTPGP